MGSGAVNLIMTFEEGNGKYDLVKKISHGPVLNLSTQEINQ